MRKIFLLICIFLTITSNAQYGDNYKTILAYPSDADIYINNEHVGKGNYNVNLEYKDRVIVTVKKTGYITATYTLFKNNPNQTITYKLEEDEAYTSSFGSGDTEVDFINKWMEIIPRKELSEDDAWRRMIAAIGNYFDHFDKMDKSSKWIRTFPKIHSYKNLDVRVTLEVKPDYSTGNLRYKVRLLFEKKEKGGGVEDWKKYDRGLKQYINLYDEIKSSMSYR